VERIGYVILYVEDLDASIAFYRDVIGLPYKFTDAGYAEFGTDGTRFALYERRRAEWLTGQAVTPGPAAEIVLVVDDVDACADRLAAQASTVRGDTGRSMSPTPTGSSSSSPRRSLAGESVSGGSGSGASGAGGLR
jgi:catechol 2,3-dioxygenase-like lactoylglutathione lyase family enzyme